MSVRKRTWTTQAGETKETWLVDYSDQSGKRRFASFAKKKDADKYHDAVRVDVRAGVQVAPAASVTVKEVGRGWITSSEAHGLERSTVEQYRQHLDFHIIPFLGGLKLSELSAHRIRKFEDTLRDQGRSPAMIRKILCSLGSLLGDAQEQDLCARNPVRDLRRSRRRGKELHAEKRQKGKLKVGVDIPTREEIKSIIANAKGRWRPLLITAIFTGLRASELRGLRWSDINFDAGEIHVHQRADRFNEIGKPKSAAGERVVPFGKFVSNTLKEWRLACPKGNLDLVFPNGAGKIESHANIVNRGLIPTQGDNPKYIGLHSLRHFYASWSINRPADGGLGLPPKVVQECMGHSSITMTLDVYGHLLPRGDDAGELDQAERSLLA